MSTPSGTMSTLAAQKKVELVSSIVSTVFWGIVTLSILILLHEGGHFLSARLFGVRVREFMLGLPGPKLSFQLGDTTYGVTAIPLGGYVRIVGMEGDATNDKLEPLLAYVTMKQEGSPQSLYDYFDWSESEITGMLIALADWGAIELTDETWSSLYVPELAENPQALYQFATKDTYVALPFWKRVTILSSGVLVNIICAVVIFTVVLAGWGTYEDQGAVKPVTGGPAQQAGLYPGDDITAINGATVNSFNDITAVVQSYGPNETIELTLMRSQDVLTKTVVLGQNPETKVAYLGVTPELTHVRPGLVGAFAKSFDYVRMTFDAILGFFTPSRFTESVKNSTSIVGISVIASQAVAAGPLEYAWLLAAISLSLGLMNLLPLPPLDGGKIVTEILEKILRRRLPMKLTLGASVAGFVLLFSLMAYLITVDIGRLIP